MSSGVDEHAHPSNESWDNLILMLIRGEETHTTAAQRRFGIAQKATRSTLAAHYPDPFKMLQSMCSHTATTKTRRRYASRPQSDIVFRSTPKLRRS